MAAFFDNFIDISIGSIGEWTDIDVSVQCPFGTTGIIVLIRDPVNLYSYGLRMKGSSDNRTQGSADSRQRFMYIGVDGNRVCQGYIGNADVKFYLVGYFTSDAVFFTNGYNKSIEGPVDWTDIDCSDKIPSEGVAAIFEKIGAGTGTIGFRKNGSSDNRTDWQDYHSGVIIGLDGNRICEGLTGGVLTTDFFLIGYLTAGTFKTNGLNKTVAGVETYIDIDMSSDSPPPNTTGVLIEIAPWWASWIALRKNGSIDDYYNIVAHSWWAIGMDANKIFELKQKYANTKIFILGYFINPPEAQFNNFGGFRWLPSLIDKKIWWGRVPK